MAGFVEGLGRGQVSLFPAQLDDYVADDNPVRAVDAFVDALDLAKLGFTNTEPLGTGRPAVCRTLGVSSQANEELQRLSQRLDDAYRHTAGNLPHNVSVRIEEANGDANLVLSPLDKLEEPESLVALRRAAKPV